MATTTNYGWTTPDDTDLVKNGASAIRSLGTSVDTALWNAGYTAGKNKIINGDFGIWQRGTSFGINAYGADRWVCSGGYASQAQQALAPATISGIDSPYYCQVTTGANSGAGDYGIFEQRIENVATLAGQQITISFYAKATSGTPKVGIELAQYFGSGGSASVFTAVQAVTLSTTWTRYTVTTTVPSVSGKTIGTGSYLGITNWVTAGSTYAARSSNIGNQNAVFWFVGYQVEAGSTATPFQTATGTKQGELAACQRYYYRISTDTNYNLFAAGNASSSTNAYIQLVHPVALRVKASSVEYSNLGVGFVGGTVNAVTNLVLDSASASTLRQNLTTTVASGLTANNYYTLIGNNSSSAYLGISAEL
jgi:hypothetical protein